MVIYYILDNEECSILQTGKSLRIVQLMLHTGEYRKVYIDQIFRVCSYVAVHIYRVSRGTGNTIDLGLYLKSSLRRPEMCMHAFTVIDCVHL